MEVRELNENQLRQLKEHYAYELADEGTFGEIFELDINEPSYGFLADIDSYITDEFIIEHYDGICFVEDDFFSEDEE